MVDAEGLPNGFFYDSKEQHGEAVKNAAETAIRNICEHYKSKLFDALESKRGELITITEKHLPGMFDKLFKRVNKTKQDYRTAVGELLTNVLTPVRDDIRDGLTGLPDFIKLRESFDWNQQQMKEKIEAFGYLDGVTCITPYLPDNFAEISGGMTLDRAEELFEKVWNEKYYKNSNNTVMVHIRHLREKMSGPTGKSDFIKTVWGVGYKFER